jgi:tetratricopeptide (TPR) repeat protein
LDQRLKPRGSLFVELYNPWSVDGPRPAELYGQVDVQPGRLPKPSGRDAIQERNIRRARWHSRIGLAQYGLGSLSECDKNIREALKLLDSPIPSSSLQFGLGLLPQVIRQVFHRYFPSRYIGSVQGRDKEVALEVARQYELMSRIYFYSNETLPIMYTVLRFLNEAEKAGISPELATAYSSMGVLAGFAQLHNLADAYVNRGLEVSAKVNNPSSTITTNVVSSVYKITVGKWDEVAARTREAMEICVRLGDYRQWGDAIVLLGESELISGDTPGAVEIYVDFLEDAHRRRNPLHQSWALFGIGATSIRTGDAEKAIPALEEALEILKIQPNLASSINMNGQLALAYLRASNSE